MFVDNLFVSLVVKGKFGKTSKSLKYYENDYKHDWENYLGLYLPLEHVCVQIKTIPWKLYILNPKNYRVFCPLSLKIS